MIIIMIMKIQWNMIDEKIIQLLYYIEIKKEILITRKIYDVFKINILSSVTKFDTFLLNLGRKVIFLKNKKKKN